MLELVYNLVGIPKHRVFPKELLYGVEIEMEGGDLIPDGSQPHEWKVVADGSLRGESQEYVLKTPLSLANSILSVEKLYQEFTRVNSRLVPSVRCGVHVHINVQQLNIVQLMNFIALYLLFEEVLCEYCGPNRVGNMFCLRARDAEGLLSSVRTAAETNSLSVFNTDQIRYCSINLKSLHKFGSVEIRTFATTPESGPIVEWLEILDSLYMYSLSLSRPTDVLSLYSDKHEEYLLQEVFKDHWKKLVSPTLNSSIKSGFRNARYVAKSVDWSSYFVVPKVANPFQKVASMTLKKSGISPVVLGRKYSELNSPTRVTVGMPSSAGDAGMVMSPDRQRLLRDRINPAYVDRFNSLANYTVTWSDELLTPTTHIAPVRRS